MFLNTSLLTPKQNRKTKRKLTWFNTCSTNMESKFQLINKISRHWWSMKEITPYIWFLLFALELVSIKISQVIQEKWGISRNTNLAIQMIDSTESIPWLRNSRLVIFSMLGVWRWIQNSVMLKLNNFQMLRLSMTERMNKISQAMRQRK